MKNILIMLFVLISVCACASTGSTVGNGLTSKSVSKLEEEKLKKLSDLCDKNHKGKIIEKEKSKICLTSEKKEITLSELEKELK